MLQYYNEYDINKISSETPKFQVNLMDELIQLDIRLYNLSEAIKGENPIEMTIREANLLQSQYRAMESYYEALFDRCLFYDLIYCKDKSYCKWDC